MFQSGYKNKLSQNAHIIDMVFKQSVALGTYVVAYTTIITVQHNNIPILYNIVYTILLYTIQ